MIIVRKRLFFTLMILLVLSMSYLAASPTPVGAANPSADLDQCANDPAPSPNTDGCNTNANQWVNGNLGASKSLYLEGDSIPYRIRFDNLPLSAHTVTIAWDTTKSSKHAIDYLTTYTQTVGTANACLGVSGCGAASTFPIPVDPHVSGGGVTPVAGNFTMYGGTINSVSVYHLGTTNTECATYPTFPASDTATYANAANTTTCIRLSFTASQANPVLAWGGRIATRKDWGIGNSAVAIPGSPYHTRLIDLDASGGNQDRSLSAEAVVFPGFIHIVKHPNGGDSPFGYTAGPAPLANFSIATSGGTGEKDFDTITNFQTYTVAENAPPADWTFTSLTCSVASPNG